VKVPAYILAGGRSSRFGSDKARATLEGKPLVVRLAQMLEPVAASVTAVADMPGKYADLGLRTIADLRPGLGPMAGLEAALDDADGEWILLTSCDLLILHSTWVERLLEQAGTDVEVVAFRDELWQPLPALYRVTLLEAVRKQLDRGELAMWKLIERARHRAAPLPADWPAVVQVNTPADLEHAERGVGRRGP
jgi:molybdenum cofactor guanylyltransferase